MSKLFSFFLAADASLQVLMYSVFHVILLQEQGCCELVCDVILVSALGPNPSFFRGLLFHLGACWDRGPDLDLDQGLTIS